MNSINVYIQTPSPKGFHTQCRQYLVATVTVTQGQPELIIGFKKTCIESELMISESIKPRALNIRVDRDTRGWVRSTIRASGNFTTDLT